MLGSRGFTVSADERTKLVDEDGPEAAARILPLRNGKDLLGEPRGIYAIDLQDMDSADEVRRRLPATFQHLHNTVLPDRINNKDLKLRTYWWKFRRSNADFRAMLAGLPQFVVTVETAKYRTFFIQPISTLCEHGTISFGLEDTFFLGVMSSRIHAVWALAAGGRLGVGNDPRYNKTACFDPFPFPTATESQNQKIRELGEALDAHRKKQQGAHPGLTITGMYNVLEKLRTGEELTAKEKKIHDDGLVSVLKKIHDDLDAAVFDAYGWPATLSDDEILERLVALNHERAAEEKRGLVRWLRPEFQNKDGAGAVHQTIDAADDDDDNSDSGDEPAAKTPKRGRGAAKKSKAKVATAAESDAADDPPAEQPPKRKAAKAAKQAWPKDLAEQTRAVRAALAAAGGIATPADVAARFKHAKSPRVEEILDTLVALGHARRTDDGYAPA
jgi:hypothetical protein